MGTAAVLVALMAASSARADDLRDAVVRPVPIPFSITPSAQESATAGDHSQFQYVPPATPEEVSESFWAMIFRLERRYAAYGQQAGGKDLVTRIREDLSTLPRRERFQVMLRFLRMAYHYSGREDISGTEQTRDWHDDRFMTEVKDFARMARRAAAREGNRTYLELFANVRVLATAGPQGLRLSKELARIAPQNPAVLRGLARDFLDDGELSHAIETSRKAIKLDPKVSQPYTTMAGAKYALRDYEGAFEAADKALKVNPRDRVATSILQLTKDRVPLPGELMPFRKGSDEKRSTKRMLLILVSTLVGGFLVALALLHVVAGLSNRSRLAAEEAAAPRLDAPIEGGIIAGSYRVVSKIGTGGMGHVYEAVDIRLDRRVAIKQMRDEISSNPRERERFLREARTVAALKHPNIVEIHSVAASGDDVFLVFEYVDGHTVEQYIQHYERLPFQHAAWVIHGTGAALEQAHVNDVIHRDLKPSNIMITREERMIKVMDFGVARQAKDTLHTLSAADTITGTPPYMAPEQEQGKVCKQSDVYAMAVCLYQMLTGQLPFAGVGTAMVMAKLEKRYIPPSRLVPDLPVGIDELMDWALEPEPAMRCPSPAKFVRHLLSLNRLPAPS